MSEASTNPETKRGKWKITVAIASFLVALAGGIVTLVTSPEKISDSWNWFLNLYHRKGSVTLAGSYPNEIWRAATPDEVSWLAGEWCYPSLRDFRTRFRIAGGTLQRQNEGRNPKPFRTEWTNTKVYASNTGLLRIAHDDPNMPASIVNVTSGKTAEWRESERYVNEDGTTRSGQSRLVLSCTRCRLSRDGTTYACQ